MKVLLADDEPTLRVTFADDLEEAGHDVCAVADGDAALAALQAYDFDCVLTDLRMPGADGMQVLRAARERHIDVVVITGAGTVDSAVEAMKRGAYDYVQKPFLSEEVLLLLERLARERALAGEVDSLKRKLGERVGFRGVIGASDAMRSVFELARSAAASEATVILVGESGTGKEVLSRAIHQESPRATGPFIPVGCGNFSETLLEDELFGHEKGAFTDAKTKRKGVFELADGGTLFLDDIDDMAPGTQVKLLRVLQEREFMRVGGSEPVRVDIRVIAASKVDLWTAMQNGRFREDLYYRLNVIQIDLPPLRERLGDIPELAREFLDRCGHSEAQISPEILRQMMDVSWKGNVRQLENAIRRALALSDAGEELSVAYLLPRNEERNGMVVGGASPPESWVLADVTRHAEKMHIEKALALHNGNRTNTAKALGISRKNLWEKMKSLGFGEE